LNLTDAATSQMSLFSRNKDNTKLMQVMDRINSIWGRGTLRSAAEGIQRNWKMKRERMSPCYTTNWEQVTFVC
jgi:DNA polymerase V